MFRTSTIIRKLALNLPKVIFMLKYSVKLHRYLFVRSHKFQDIYMHSYLCIKSRISVRDGGA